MKAVILAAGHGTRMRPYTFSKPKHLLPVANKPVMQYLIEALKAIDVRDIQIIVGHLQEAIREYFEDGSKFGVRISYIEQKEKLGLAHAVGHSKQFIGNSPFIVILGDVLFTSGLADLLEKHKKSGAEASIVLTKVDNPTAFGVVEMKGEQIVRLVEKPKVPPSNLAIAGIYFFSSPRIFGIIDSLKPSARGEYEITDAIQGLINAKHAVNGLVLDKWWKDTGKPQDLLETNKSVLDDMFNGQANKVIVGKNCRISETTNIEGPAMIGDGCEIIDSKIRPYTCIQKNNKVTSSVIENSILMEDSTVKNMSLHDSVIGSGCLIRSEKKESKKHTFYIGDKSQVDIIGED